MKKMIHSAPDSFVVSLTNGSGADVAVGMPIEYAGGFLIAQNAIADGAEGVGHANVVVTLTALTTDVWADGDDIYWDATNSRLTDTALGNKRIGQARGAKANGETTADVFVPTPLGLDVDPVAVKIADYTVLASESGKTFSTDGAAGAVVFALPAATPGLKYDFYVGAAQELRIDPNGSEQISLPSTGVPGAAGKYLTANAVGETVSLKCVEAGVWAVFGFTGTWTAEA